MTEIVLVLAEALYTTDHVQGNWQTAPNHITYYYMQDAERITRACAKAGITLNLEVVK